MARRPLKSLHPRKPKPAKKDPKRVAQMLQNRLVVVNLKIRHYINGEAFGPGPTKMPAHMAQGLEHTEAHAADVEEQFRGDKAVIIGPRRSGGFTTKQVPVEMFDSEWTSPHTAVADRINGSQYGSDNNSGNKF